MPREQLMADLVDSFCGIVFFTSVVLEQVIADVDEVASIDLDMRVRDD